MNEELMAIEEELRQNLENLSVSEKALKESEERFRVIAETSPVLLSVSSIADGTVLFTNPAYDQAFGFRRARLPGCLQRTGFTIPPNGVRIIDTLRENGELYGTAR